MRLALAALLLLACKAPATRPPVPDPQPAPARPPARAELDEPKATVIVETLRGSSFQPSLDLTPMEATVASGGTVSFSANMNYPEGIRYMRQPVKWEVMEAEGGAVTMHGLYTAPTAAGTFHVKVTRTDAQGQNLSRTATVTVK